VKDLQSSTANIKDADDALKEFTRFPVWMWFVFDFIEGKAIVYILYSGEIRLY